MPPQRRPISDDLRTRVLDALRSGVGHKTAAKQCGTTEWYVRRIAHEAGLDTQREATKKATETRLAWDSARRVGLLSEVLQRARELMPQADTPQKLQSLVTAMAIAVDKIRLETGEATARTETTERRVYEITQRLVTDRAAVELHERLLERLSASPPAERQPEGIA